MTEILSTTSLFSFIGSGVFLVLTVIIWFLFRIPSVIGDLSGRNARKSIEQMRKNNEKKRKKKQNNKQIRQNNMIYYETGILKENRANVYQNEETSLLEETATALLTEDNETALLDETEVMHTKSKHGGVELTMIEEILLVHTNEVI